MLQTSSVMLSQTKTSENVNIMLYVPYRSILYKLNTCIIFINILCIYWVSGENISLVKLYPWGREIITKMWNSILASKEGEIVIKAMF